MLIMAYTAILPVFYYTSIALGGWGLTSRQSSVYMAFCGLLQAFWLLFIFPPLQHRVGTAGVLRICIYSWPICFILNPLDNIFLKMGLQSVFQVAAPFTVFFTTSVAMASTGVQLAINEISPSPATLGTLNALALTMSSAVRAVTPGIFASRFSISVKTQMLWGHMVWVILVVLTLGMVVGIEWLPSRISSRRNI